MIYENPLPLVTSFPNHFGNILFLIFSLIFSALTLFSIYMEHQAPKHWYQVANDEYNFMASADSEQSRLDLAEAYISIGQSPDARTILNELLTSRNPITKEKAKQLLKDINHMGAFGVGGTNGVPGAG
jgi:FimV-like protein